MRILLSRARRQASSLGNHGYPPVVDTIPDEIEGKKPTVFYCIQEDLNKTLVNKTLNDEGFGVCNISGELVSCPIEIECKITEADNCCEGKFTMLPCLALRFPRGSIR